MRRQVESLTEKEPGRQRQTKGKKETLPPKKKKTKNIAQHNKFSKNE